MSTMKSQNMSEIPSLSKLKENLKVSCVEDHRGNRRYSWSAFGLTYQREVSKHMANYYGNPSDYLSQMQNQAISALANQLSGIGHVWNSTTASPLQQASCVQSSFDKGWGNAYSSMPRPGVMHSWITRIKFFRVNDEIELEEGGTYLEPLDELRIKIKKWLKR